MTLTYTPPPVNSYPPRFLACMPFTLIQECPHPENWSSPSNFSNDPGDPGGKTMCGIIQTEFNQYCRNHGLPLADVRQLTREQGYEIYFNNFWLSHCPSLPVGLDLSFFDEAVNTGPSQAVRVLQVAIGTTNDGAWGPKTMAAVQAIGDVESVISRFTNRRKAVYRMMGGFSLFGTDWIRRATEIGAEATKMAEAATKVA